jgi:hypothetical protein
MSNIASDEKAVAQDSPATLSPAGTKVDPDAPSAEVSSKKQSLSDIFTIVSSPRSVILHSVLMIDRTDMRRLCSYL